jgi:hypothetical protein
MKISTKLKNKEWPTWKRKDKFMTHFRLEVLSKIQSGKLDEGFPFEKVRINGEINQLIFKNKYGRKLLNKIEYDIVRDETEPFFNVILRK